MHLQEIQCEMVFFLKKMIQIPTLNESENYHLYTQENRFSTTTAMVKMPVDSLYMNNLSELYSYIYDFCCLFNCSYYFCILYMILHLAC